MDYSQASRLSVHRLRLHILGVGTPWEKVEGMMEIKEIKSQVRDNTICTHCRLTDSCLEKYPDVGCPAFRLLKKIAEEAEV